MITSTIDSTIRASAMIALAPLAKTHGDSEILMLLFFLSIIIFLDTLLFKIVHLTKMATLFSLGILSDKKAKALLPSFAIFAIFPSILFLSPILSIGLENNDLLMISLGALGVPLLSTLLDFLKRQDARINGLLKLKKHSN